MRVKLRTALALIFELGYSNLANFSRQFKRWTEMSPSRI